MANDAIDYVRTLKHDKFGNSILTVDAFVLFLIADGINNKNDNKYYPSKKYLAEQVRVSPRYIQTVIQRLIAGGLLASEPKRRKDGGQSSNSYSLPGYAPKQSLSEQSKGGSLRSPARDLPISPPEIPTSPLVTLEPLIEPLLIKGENADQPAGRRRGRPPKATTIPLLPVEPPDPLRSFDRVLRGLSGYAPTASFYQVVSSRYSHLDLEVEAVKIEDWINRHPDKPCSTARVLHWLTTAAANPKPTQGGQSNGLYYESFEDFLKDDGRREP